MPWPVLIGTAAFSVRMVLLPFRVRVALNSRLMACATVHCNEFVAPHLKAHYKSLPGPNAESLYKQAITQQWARIARHVGASPWKALSVPMVAIPCFLGMSGGLRQLALNDSSLLGAALAGSQPLSAVPGFIFNLAQIELNRRERALKDPNKNVLRTIRTNLPYLLSHGVNVLGLVLLSQMPAVLNLFLGTSSALSLMELLIGRHFKFSFLDQWAQSVFRAGIRTFEAPPQATPALKS